MLALCLQACDEAEPASAESEQPLVLAVPAAAKQVALGRAHGCSLDPGISGVICWGANQRGQANVPLLLDPRSVAAGGDVSCAIDGGNVSCWGDNSRRQLSVPWGLRAVQLAVGGTHVCALDTAGAVRCWGDNSLRQLNVPALVKPEQLAAGGFHNCAIDAGKVACWGGDVPALLSAIPSVRAPSAIAAGRSHSCVLDAAGVRCWGDPARDLTPRELTRPQQLAVGGGDGLAYACARHLQGVTCWGDDSLGQTEYDGFPWHVLYRAEAEIDAPADVVWDVLMDLDAYPLWNPYTIAMRSTLRVGDPMIMTVKMNELLTLEQTEHIRVLEAGHKVCWGIETDTPEFNSGERCQWLEPLPGGGTRYVTEDLIEGLANPLVLGLFDSDLQRGFDGVAAGLKARAEALAP